MKKKSDSLSKMKTLFSVIFSLFGIIMIIISISMKISFDRVIKDGVSAKGYISDIISDGDDGHDVFITYTVDGVEQTRRINYYTSSMYVGKRATVYYYPENPEKIYYPTSFGPIMLGGMGAVFLLVGSGFTYSIVRIKSRNKLIDTGARVMAEVSYCGFGTLSVNNRRTYIVKAEWADECGVLHKFKSQPLMQNPSLEPNSDIVEVFIDPSNYKKYKMNI